MGIGLSEYLLIAVVLLILFGPKKLPEMGRALGRMIREFKNSAQGILDDEDDSASKPKPAATEPAVPVNVEEKKYRNTDSRRLPD